MKRLRILVLSLSILLGSSMCVTADEVVKEGSIIKYEESKESNETVLENVKVNEPITIKFESKIDTSDKNCVYLFEKDSEMLIEVNVGFGESEKEIVITPKEDYKYDTEYKFYIVSLKYKDNSSSVFQTYNFKTEKYVEQKEKDNVVGNIEKKGDKVNQSKVEKNTKVKENTDSEKNPKSLLEQVSELSEEINKLPVQFEGVGYDFRINEESVINYPDEFKTKFPNEEEWIWISDKVREELYEYPYWKILEKSFWTNNKQYNFQPSSTSYAMPGKYSIENTCIPLAKGYFESKYTYDYRKQEENMLSVLPYTKSGCPLEYDEKEDKELFPDDVYKRYLEKFKNEKIVSTAEFITDDSLVYSSMSKYFIRGTLRIKYVEGTSQEFLDKYNLKRGVWYEIDKEVAFSNMSEDTEMWNRWVSKTVYTMVKEFNLSGLREINVEKQEYTYDSEE